MFFLYFFILSAVSILPTVSLGSECITVKGYVWCGPKLGDDHDGKMVYVNLIDGDRGTLDEAYTSKNGRFALKGCSQRTISRMSPELQIFHSCKHNQPKRLKVPIPDIGGPDFVLPQPINLKFDSDDEESWQFDTSEPCDAA